MIKVPLLGLDADDRLPVSQVLTCLSLKGAEPGIPVKVLGATSVLWVAEARSPASGAAALRYGIAPGARWPVLCV